MVCSIQIWIYEIVNEEDCLGIALLKETQMASDNNNVILISRN